MAAKKQPGPYVTISRQYGCDGIELGELLVERLNERGEEKRWRFFHKDILQHLAQETGLAAESLEKERSAAPNLMKEFLRGLKREGMPGGVEIRNKLTLLVRTIAFNGHAVILGQGGTAATGDLANGLSVRVTAPKDWRIARICLREGVDKQTAAARIDEIAAERDRLRLYYERQNPRAPAFNLAIDNSAFNHEQITALILLAMEERRLAARLDELGENT
ncbi:MAG: cytidylate kinase-like family protein [Planctomycetaceae bacterium]|nr:cytidylate kinase-like family protein [Planctomycetaceae bacterium]